MSIINIVIATNIATIKSIERPIVKNSALEIFTGDRVREEGLTSPELQREEEKELRPASTAEYSDLPILFHEERRYRYTDLPEDVKESV